MSFISILLFIVGFYGFFNNKRYLTLIIILILSSSWFGFAEPILSLGPIQLQNGDLALLLIFVLLPFRNKYQNSQLNGIKNALILFLLFFSVSVAYDYIFRGTSPMQIFRTTRHNGYLAFFFLINSFSWRDYRIFFKYVIIITVIHAILYISQYLFGINLSSQEIDLNEFGGARYRNDPPYLIPAFVFLIFLIEENRLYKWYIVLFILAVILTQSRGAIISTITVVFLFFILNKKMKIHTLLFISLITISIYNITLNYFPIISERFNDSYTQYNSFADLDFNNLESFYYQGSFIFRIGLTFERLMYVLSDPITTLIGVGYIPDMDLTSPIFILGTESPILPVGYEQYNSVDIFFPNIITRYGITGSIIFLYLIFQLFVFSFKHRQYLFGKILLTYLMSLLLISFIYSSFYNGHFYFIIFILIGLTMMEIKSQVINNIQNK